MDIVIEYAPRILSVLVSVGILAACVWSCHKAGLFKEKERTDRES